MSNGASVDQGQRADTAPLSLNQEFLCNFDRGDAEGAFGRQHILTAAWLLDGSVDTAVLQRSLDGLVARHEILRTSIVEDGDSRRQHVHPPCPVPLTVRDLPGGPADDPARRAEELLNEVDAGAQDVRRLPHLSAVLARRDDRHAVLVLTTHHTATDGWSMGVLMRDLADLYALGGVADPALPAPAQYREFAVRQREQLDTAPVEAARRYWTEKLRGAEILAIPTERPRPRGVPNAFAAHRFALDPSLAAATAALARGSRATSFMVLLTAHVLLLRRLTGAVDVTVPTFTSGRSDERFADTVGPFLNFLPLRTDLTGCATGRAALARVRATCLEAYAHDIPFPLVAEDSPGLTRQFLDDSRTVVTFEVLQSPAYAGRAVDGRLGYTELRRRVISQPHSSHIPDGALWAFDVLPDGGVVGGLKYNTHLLSTGAVTRLADDFVDLLRTLVTRPDSPLAGC